MADKNATALPSKYQESRETSGAATYYEGDKNATPLSGGMKFLHFLWGAAFAIFFFLFGLIPLCVLRNKHRKKYYSIGFIVGIIAEIILAIITMILYKQLTGYYYWEF